MLEMEEEDRLLLEDIDNEVRAREDEAAEEARRNREQYEQEERLQEEETQWRQEELRRGAAEEAGVEPAEEPRPHWLQGGRSRRRWRFLNRALAMRV